MHQLNLRSKTAVMTKNNTATSSKSSNTKEVLDSPCKDLSNNDLAGLIKSQGRTTQEQINKLGFELREEINKGLDSIREDLAEVNDKLLQVKEDVADNKEAIARSLLSNDLIISGVPYMLNENLSTYFQSWCKVLGYTDSSTPLVDLRRLSKSQPREGSNCFILVQFAISNQRNDFFAKYLRSTSLTLAQIGLQSDKRIYVNENLIPSARKVKSKAVEMKKEGKLASVFCRGGIVHIKLPGSDQDRIVKSEAELLRIVHRS